MNPSSETTLVASDATIAVLDGLGASELGLQEARRWVQAIQTVARQMRALSADTVARARLVSGSDSVPEPLLRVLGDTIVLVWWLPTNPTYALLQASMDVQQIVIGCLQHKIPLRGAVSYGELAWDAETALGRAVAEARDWYEAANWLGVMATPTCAEELQRLAQVSGMESVSQFFIPYRVPLKCEATRPDKTWALSWPIELAVEALKAHTAPSKLLEELLGGMPRDPSHEPIYAAGAAFFEHYMAQWATHSTRIGEAAGRSRA